MMDKVLRPERFDADPNCPTAAKLWKHWHTTFENFITVLSTDDAPINKLAILTNYVSSSVYEYIAECTVYDAAISLLENLYVKPKNVIFARHLLATRKQDDGESLDHFLQSLVQLSKDCNFEAVDAATYSL